MASERPNRAYWYRSIYLFGVSKRCKTAHLSVSQSNSTLTWGIGAEFPDPQNPVFSPCCQQHNAFGLPVAAATAGFSLNKRHGIYATLLLREIGLNTSGGDNSVGTSLGKDKDHQTARLLMKNSHR